MTLSKRFHQNYDETDTCWNWTKSTDKDGYGYIKDGKTKKAHRVSYELHVGPIPKGMWVLHKCDNPSCVNPEHLWLGTALDNNQDMIKKGRRVFGAHDNNGEKNPNVKITPAQVQYIRDNYQRGLGPVFAKQFDVSVPTISRIVRHKAWK